MIRQPQLVRAIRVINARDFIEDVAVEFAAVERPGTKPRERRGQIIGFAPSAFGDLISPVENVSSKLFVVECRDGCRAPFVLDYPKLAPVFLCVVSARMSANWGEASKRRISPEMVPLARSRSEVSAAA